MTRIMIANRHQKDIFKDEIQLFAQIINTNLYKIRFKDYTVHSRDQKTTTKINLLNYFWCIPIPRVQDTGSIAQEP